MNPQYIKINMVPNGVVPVLYCSQYDVGRPLGMVVYNGSETVDLDDYTVTFEATRTDGTAITAAITTDGNVCALETTATMTNKAGRYPAQIVVTDGNGKRIASIPINCVVIPAAMDEDAEGVEEDRSLYQQYTGTVQSLIADIRTQLNAETAARQAAVSAEASARQAADNTLQSNINVEASARATQDNVLQAEIDQLVAPSGSAPSAAEVTNARIGADGTTYDTLGNAIRGQVTDVKSALEALPFVDTYETVPITWVQTDKYITNNGTEVTSSYYFQCEISVSAGEEYLLNGTNDYGKAIYATLDANGDPVRHPRTANDNSHVEDIEIVISDTEKKLVLQAKANDRQYYAISRYIGKKMVDGTIEYADFNDNVKSRFAAYEKTSVNLFDDSDPDIMLNHYVGGNSYTASTRFNVSGYIPVENGKTYSFPVFPGFFGSSVAARVYCYKADKTYYTFLTGTISDGNINTFTVSNANVAYVRINYANGSVPSDIQTIYQVPQNIMFCESPYPTHRYYPYGDYMQLKEDVLVNDATASNFNPLTGKSALFLGDSICNGSSANDGFSGWAGRIGLKNSMLWKNSGISGGTFTDGLSGSAGVISNSSLFDTDYVIIEGGTNDADLIGSIIDGNIPPQFGSFDESDYTSAFANTTFCGAVEFLIKKAVTENKGAKIGMIIAPKMGQLNTSRPDYTAAHNNRRAYFETLINICKKWGIPVLNLWDECYLNPMLPAHYTSGETYMYTDGQHLTSNGYDYITPIIEAWMRSL